MQRVCVFLQSWYGTFRFWSVRIFFSNTRTSSAAPPTINGGALRQVRSICPTIYRTNPLNPNKPIQPKQADPNKPIHLKKTNPTHINATNPIKRQSKKSMHELLTLVRLGWVGLFRSDWFVWFIWVCLFGLGWFAWVGFGWVGCNNKQSGWYHTTWMGPYHHTFRRVLHLGAIQDQAAHHMITHSLKTLERSGFSGFVAKWLTTKSFYFHYWDHQSITRKKNQVWWG